MSFILDALRKSENERRRQNAPGIADARQRSTAPRRSRWIPVLAVVLAANALLITLLLFRGTDEAPDQTTVQVPVPPAGANRDRPDIRPLSAETPRQPDVAPPIEPAPVPEAVAPTAANAPAADAVADTPTSNAADAGDEVLPSMQQLTLAGILTMPPMRLDIHVYSDERDQRFVFVNMRKYREGDQLKEGPVLDEITPIGVVLSHQGNRFTLERE